MTVLVAVTFLLHIFLKHPSSSLDGIKDIRNANTNAIELIKDSIVSTAHKATKEEILTLQDQIKSLVVVQEEINKEYTIKKENAKISGFPSLHKFSWHFGIGLIILSLSIYLLVTVNMFDGERRKAVNFASMIAMTISGYYMAWIFFPYDDLPYNTYMSILVFLGVLSSITAYRINKVDFLTRNKLTGMVRHLMNLIVVKAIDLELIKDVKVYTTEIIEPAINKLDGKSR